MTASAADPRLERLYQDCVDLARYIAHARREVAAMRPHELKAEKLPRAGQELDTIVKETETATNSIMSSAEAIMALDAADPAAYKAAVESECMKIFESCSFQDITGQRIRKVVQTINHIEQQLDRLQKVWGPDLHDAGSEDAREGDAALLNGPQLHGQGVDQAAVDALLQGDHPPSKPAPAGKAASQSDIDALFD